jgi:hypothetical protein
MAEESVFKEEDIPVFEPFTFTPEKFKEGVKTQGISNLTSSIVEMQAGTAAPGLFSYQTLRNGQAPLLNFLPGFKDLAVEDRKLTDEQILPFFTNVQDFGGGDGAGYLAFIEKAKRTAAPAGGMLAGAYGGAKTGVIASASIPHPLAKGAVILGNTLFGALTGDFLGRETSDFILGEEEPVIPSLQPMVNSAETLTYGISMLGTPWLLPTKTGSIGAVRAIDNFKKISMGRNAELAKKGYYDFDRALDVIAASEGLTNSLLTKALRAEKNVGLTRFIKPDPRKGPLNLRVLSGIEKGIAKAGQSARANPSATLITEGVAVGGASGGAFASEVVFPGSDWWRLGFEVAGGGLPPLTLKPVLTGVNKGFTGALNLYKKYASGDPAQQTMEEAIQSKRMTEVGTRLFEALENSPEIEANPALLGQAIKLLGEGILDETGTIIDEKNVAVLDSTSLSAFFASKQQPKLAKVFARIEQELGRTSDELAVASKKGREAYIQGAKATIIGAVNNGDVDALQAAGFLAESLFYDNISNNVRLQVTNLMKAAERVQGGSKYDLSGKLYNLLNDQITLTKNREKQLWDNVGNTIIQDFVNKEGQELEFPNIIEALRTPMNRGGVFSLAKGSKTELAAALGGFTEDLDDIIKFFGQADTIDGSILFNNSEAARRRVPRGDPMNASRLFDIRSSLLSKAKALRAQGNDHMALRLENLSAAILQDLVGSKTTVANGYNIARAYSKAKNDFFTRSFLGDVQDFNVRGGTKITPDNLLDRLFAGGSSATYLRIKDIMATNKFVLDEDLGAKGVENIFTIHETLENVVKRTFKNMVKDKVVSIDPDGTEITAPVIDPAAYEKYVKSDEAQAIFRVFPKLHEDLKTLKKAQETFTSFGKDVKLFKESDDVKAFQSVLESQTENPASAVTFALNSKRPEAAINGLLKLTEKADSFKNADGKVFTSEQAKLGLRSSILSYAITKAGGSGYKFNPRAMQDALFGVVKGADPKASFRLSSWMLKNDIADKEHLNLIQKALKEMVNVEEAFITGDLETLLFKKPSGAKMFQARMIGATLGAKAQQTFNNLLTKIGIGGPGSQIGGGMVAASEGSKQMLNLFFNMPEQAKVKIMLDLMKDKKKLGILLQEAQTAGQAQGLANRLSTMLSALFVEQVSRRAPYLGKEVGSDVYEEDKLVFPETIAEEEPPNVTSQVEPTLPAPKERSQQPAMFSQVSPTLNPVQNTQPVNKQRFAALFPEDRALIEGIGSLRG